MKNGWCTDLLINKRSLLFLALIFILLGQFPSISILHVKRGSAAQTPLAFRIEPNQTAMFINYVFEYTVTPVGGYHYYLNVKTVGGATRLTIEWPLPSWDFPWNKTWSLHLDPNNSESPIFSFKVAKDPQVPLGEYKYAIYVYNIVFEGDFQLVYDLDISASSETIYIYRIAEEQELTFTVENVGTYKVKNVDFSLSFTPYGYMLVSDKSDEATGLINEISPGTSKKLKYVFRGLTTQQLFSTVSLTIEYMSFSQPISIINQLTGETVTCLTLSPTVETKTVYIAVGKPPQPKEFPNIVVNAYPVRNLKPGESANIKADFRNIGNGSAYNASIFIEVNPSEPILVYKGEETNLIGPIHFVNRETGEPIPLPSSSSPVSFSFKIKAPEHFEGGNKSYLINVWVEYYSKTGVYYKSEANTTVKIIKPGKPVVSITKTISASVVGLGSEITVTITVENVGSGPAYNVEVSDSYPEGPFTLISGTLKKKYKVLPAGQKSSLTYKIQAVNEYPGGLLPKATVTYEDSEGLSYSAQSNPSSISVLQPKLSMSMGSYPSELEVDQVFEISYVVSNKGTGPGSNILVQVNYSRGLELVHSESSMGNVDEEGRTVSVTVDELLPNQEVEIRLMFRGLLPGEHYINVSKKTYKSSDGSKQFAISGENLSATLTIITPLFVRSLLVIILGAMVAIIEYAVLSTTFKLSTEKSKKKRLKLG